MVQILALAMPVRLMIPAVSRHVGGPREMETRVGALHLRRGGIILLEQLEPGRADL